MVINDDMHWYKNVLIKHFKLSLRIYLSIAIVFSPIYLINNALAGAAESWNIEKVTYDNIGKTLSYQASKIGTSANDYLYNAKVPVTAAATGSTVASMIRLGLAGAAIYGLVESVGWIIDNGVVKKLDPNQAQLPNYPYFYRNQEFTDYSALSVCKFIFTTALARKDNGKADQSKGYTCNTSSVNSMGQPIFDHSHTDVIGRITNHKLFPISNSDYDPDLKPIYTAVSDAELGEEVNSSPNAPTLLPEIYNPSNPAGGQAPNSTNDALNSANPVPRNPSSGQTSNKPNQDTDGDGVADTHNPELPSEGSEFTLPEFCGWASTVCDWYVKYTEDSKKIDESRLEQKSFWQKVEDFFNWTKEDPEHREPEKLEFDQLDLSVNEVNLNASSACPQDSVNFSLMGRSVTLQMPYQPICDALNFFKPAVLLVGAISSVYIVAGIRTKEVDE